ncbi:aminotransferase class IV [Sulfurihydrogenibium sp.]|uniref:aminotransferase class IV n=1 Tax=Sulfurihydrogenibium sp. TaxID=2053621 RepID=UPI002636F400|nr:aminotransferase class IV [Sulfurihydrogenibium sp.]
MEKVFFNGKIFEDKEFLRPLMYGEGVFETFRYKGKLPKYIEYHYERLVKGANILKIPTITKEDYIYYIEEAVKVFEEKDLYVKTALLSEGNSYYPLLPYKSNLLVIVRPYQPVNSPITLTLSPYKVHSKDPLLKIKSTNYLRNVLIKRYAQEKGFFDAIILNEDDNITETSSANIFWIKGKYLYTPSTDCGVLEGIARRKVLEEAKNQGFIVVEGSFNLKDLKGANVVFLTNSLHGILKVDNIDPEVLK